MIFVKRSILVGVFLFVFHISAVFVNAYKEYIYTKTIETPKFGDTIIKEPFVIEEDYDLKDLMNELFRAQSKISKKTMINDFYPFLRMDADFQASNVSSFEDFFSSYAPKHSSNTRDSAGLILEIINEVSERGLWVKDSFFFAPVDENVTPDTIEAAKKVSFNTTEVPKGFEVDTVVGVIVYQHKKEGRLTQNVILIDAESNTITMHSLNGHDSKNSVRFYTEESDLPEEGNVYTQRCAYTIDKYKERIEVIRSSLSMPEVGLMSQLSTNERLKFRSKLIERRTLNPCFIERGRYAITDFYDFTYNRGPLEAIDLVNICRSVSHEDIFKMQLLKNPVRMMLKVGGAFEVSPLVKIPTGRLEAFVFVQLHETHPRLLDNVFTVGFSFMNNLDQRNINLATFSSTGKMSNDAVRILREVSGIFDMESTDLIQKLKEAESVIENYKNIFQKLNENLKPRPPAPYLGWLLQFKSPPGIMKLRKFF